MKTRLAAVIAMFVIGGPALAAGDAEKGAKLFNQCQTCHVVANEAGEVLAGKNAKTGPNLYAVIGRKAGSYEGFKYGDDMVAAGEKGLVWDEATFVEYVQDPSGFLKTYLEDDKAKGKMSFKVKNAEDAADLHAFLVSLAPAADAATAPAEEPAEDAATDASN